MKRIIPSLSLDPEARVVDDVAFVSRESAGDPVQIAAAYAEAGADQLLFDARQTSISQLLALARRLSSAMTIPFAFRVEPRTPADADPLLSAGSVGVVLQRSALEDPDLIAQLAKKLGGDAVTVAMTVRREAAGWRVLDGIGGGDTEWDAATWAAVVEAQGAGELIIESVNPVEDDAPFDLALLESVRPAFRRPLVAAGEARELGDLFDALMTGGADAVLVGTLLHSGRTTVGEIRDYLSDRGLLYKC